jgi:hypothetical protein
LAREGKLIMQFRCKGRYVANVCEGKRRVSIALRHSHTEITDFCLVVAC